MEFSLKPAINSWPLANVVQGCLFVPVGVWGGRGGKGQQLVNDIYDRFIKYKWNNWLQNHDKPSLDFCKLVLNTLWNLMNTLCRKQTAAQPKKIQPLHSTWTTAMGWAVSPIMFPVLSPNTPHCYFRSRDSLRQGVHHTFGAAGLPREKKKNI